MASDDFDLIVGIDFGTTGSGMKVRLSFLASNAVSLVFFNLFMKTLLN